nr:MAG: ORF1 [TTV-like mini virus]
MPFYWRPWRPRWRRPWRRRFRQTVRRRRFWRRRKRYTVRRKRKLKTITVKQWQPNTIRKLTILGQYPLFCGTTERIGNDYISYIDSIAPQHYPGGGLFSIIVFTLNGLYELHQKSRNWWTKSNCNLPLIRYHGCTIKFYYSSSVDYVSVPIRCGELKANEQTFQSCQPSVLMLNKRKKVMLCKNFKHRRKPYRKMYIKPPALLLNKWYFQKDIANYPLLMLLSSAASLDRYFCPASSVSETIGFTCLNTSYFINHGFKTTTTTPYTPNNDFALFGILGHHTFETATAQDLVLLGNPLEFSKGTQIGNSGNWQNQVESYFASKPKWGNPFNPFWFSSDPEEGLVCHMALQGKTVMQALLDNTKTSQGNTQVKSFCQIPSKPFKIQCRYNPQQDMGHNAVFITRIKDDNTPWHQPTDDTLIQQGYPLWLIFMGWHDYLVKAHAVQQLDTNYITAIVSDYIHPTPKDQNITYFVPLDWFFLDGRSPYADKDDIKGFDLQNWHPKNNFQTQTIAHILQTGPATAKLPPLISAEAHITYKFHFKVGGCPPSMDEVCNPQTQPSYPQPGNPLSSILLQNPEYPIQYYISSFDQRRQMLTHRAAKRLKEDTGFTDSIFKPTGQSLLSVQAVRPQTSPEETSEEEEEQETLQRQLHKHGRLQRKLQQRILELLETLQTTT